MLWFIRVFLLCNFVRSIVGFSLSSKAYHDFHSVAFRITRTDRNFPPLNSLQGGDVDTLDADVVERQDQSEIPMSIEVNDLSNTDSTRTRPAVLRQELGAFEGDDDDPPRNSEPTRIDSGSISRRQALRQGLLLLSSTGAIAYGSTIDGTAINDKNARQPNYPGLASNLTNPIKTLTNGSPTKSTSTIPSENIIKGGTSTSSGKLAPVNITQVAAETRINITLECNKECVSLDSKNFTKIQTKKTPKWYPAFLIPPPKVVKEISNQELLVAATIAGSATEMARTSLLYPLQTIKTRIQTDIHNVTDNPPSINERLLNLGGTVRRHVEEGGLYAGLKPSLLVSVPAMGVYYGVRDVSKRSLGTMTTLSDVAIILGAALIADVISLCFRTPADTLALRLQDQSDDVGDWIGDSLKRLPSVIVTDLPYLLSKIVLGRQFIQGDLSIDRYAEFAVISAIVAAFLTTPFDVARTRILVDSDGNFSNGFDGGSGEGVIKTMRAVMKEGEGGIANLFAGWLERVLYLGIGRAWLEPLQIIAYVAIRDTILLELF